MHNSLTLKRQGYLLTNKYIHYICADKINAMIKTIPTIVRSPRGNFVQ